MDGLCTYAAERVTTIERRMEGIHAAIAKTDVTLAKTEKSWTRLSLPAPPPPTRKPLHRRPKNSKTQNWPSHTPGSVKKRSRISKRRQQQFPLLLLLHDSTAHQTHRTTQHSTDHKTKTSMHERFIAPPLLHLCPRSSSTVKWPSLLCLRRSNSNNSHWQ